MAQVTINIPDSILPRVIEGLCAYTGQPETAGNAKSALIKLVMAHLTQYEATKAALTAQREATQKTGSEINLS